MSLLDRQQDYSFSRYFDMGLEASELATELGYNLTRKNLQLPQFSGELDRIGELHDRLEEVLPYVPLTSELARREIIISRVMTEVIHYTHAELRIEYPLKVSNWLQGNLDYLFQLKNPATQFVVIEAKYEDLTRGFTQLVDELAAVRKSSEPSPRDSVGNLVASIGHRNCWSRELIVTAYPKIWNQSCGSWSRRCRELAVRLRFEISQHKTIVHPIA